MSKTNLGGWGGCHRACLGDVVQNIAKMGVFTHLPRGAAPGASFTKVGLNRTNFKLSDYFYQFSI